MRAPSPDIGAQWDLASSLVQADIAVISAPPNDRIITTRISFPSGWAPERILGQSFGGLHGPVPTFANRKGTAQNLAKAMCTKGPFVRFVDSMWRRDFRPSSTNAQTYLGRAQRRLPSSRATAYGAPRNMFSFLDSNVPLPTRRPQLKCPTSAGYITQQNLRELRAVHSAHQTQSSTCKTFD